MKGAGRYPLQKLSLRRVQLSIALRAPAPLQGRQPMNRRERRQLARVLKRTGRGDE